MIRRTQWLVGVGAAVIAGTMSLIWTDVRIDSVLDGRTPILGVFDRSNPGPLGSPYTGLATSYVGTTPTTSGLLGIVVPLLMLFGAGLVILRLEWHRRRMTCHCGLCGHDVAQGGVHSAARCGECGARSVD